MYWHRPQREWLEHRTEKWNPVFGLFRCSIKPLERSLCVQLDARRSKERSGNRLTFFILHQSLPLACRKSVKRFSGGIMVDLIDFAACMRRQVIPLGCNKLYWCSPRRNHG
jgi:hypothetical protein